MQVKYVFSAKESVISDFLQLPLLWFVKEDNSNDIYSELVDEDALVFGKKAKELLKPYQKDIEKFYSEELSMIMLLNKYFGFFGYENWEAYLKYLMSLDTEALIKGMVYGILKDISASGEHQEIPRRAEEISKDSSKLMAFIKNLPFKDGVKWMMFCIVQEPRAYMEQYVVLMQKLTMLFSTLYKEMEPLVKTYGEQLMEALNVSKTKTLSDITNHLLTEDAFESEEVRIVISSFFPYTIMLSSGEPEYVQWGLKVEEAFIRIKEYNENKLNERVTVYKNLGDKTRYEVLRNVAKGITSTKEIAENLGVSSATISYHLSNLTTSKILVLEKQGNHFEYAVNHAFIRTVMEGFLKDLGQNIEE